MKDTQILYRRTFYALVFCECQIRLLVTSLPFTFRYTVTCSLGSMLVLQLDVLRQTTPHSQSDIFLRSIRDNMYISQKFLFSMSLEVTLLAMRGRKQWLDSNREPTRKCFIFLRLRKANSCLCRVLS